MAWFDGLLTQVIGPKMPDLAVSVLGGLVVALVVGGTVWAVRRARKSLGLREPPMEVVLAPDTSDVEERPVNTLPRPTAHYQGDKALIGRIIETLERSSTASLVGLAGMGGIGKTEAAIITAWAMLKKGRFRDGAVLIDLMGFSPDGHPVGHESALRRLASMLGAPPFGPRPDEVPESEWVDALGEKWRGMTAGRDLLVILDNAKDAEHVRPLIPGADGPRVLITSRNAINLPGQADSIGIALLDDARAARLARSLTKALEPPLTDRQVERLVGVSLGLPLLLETVAGVIVGNRARPAADWLAEFERAGVNVPIEDVETRVKARLGVSVDALDETDRARYAALSLFEGGFHAQSAYALWELDETQGALALGRLDGRSLLIPAASPFSADLGRRYRLHDYLAAVAAERFSALPQQARTGNRHRWGREALKLLNTTDELLKTKGSDLTGLRLFEQEQETIRSAQRWSAERAEADDVAADLAMRFPNFAILDLRLTPRESIDWLEVGLPAARRFGDRQAEAAILGNLGHRLGHLGDLAGAEARLNDVLQRSSDLGDRHFEALTWGNLGNIYQEQNKFAEAEKAYQSSLTITETDAQSAEERGDAEAVRRAEAISANLYNDLGLLHSRQGRFDDAEAEFGKSLDISERLGLRGASASTYGNLGILYRRQGDLAAAAEAHEKSLEIETDLRRRDGMAAGNFNLALLRLQQGQVTLAREHAATARDLYAAEGLDHRVAEADALLAEIARLAGSGSRAG